MKGEPVWQIPIRGIRAGPMGVQSVSSNKAPKKLGPNLVILFIYYIYKYYIATYISKLSLREIGLSASEAWLLTRPQ